MDNLAVLSPASGRTDHLMIRFSVAQIFLRAFWLLPHNSTASSSSEVSMAYLACYQMDRWIKRLLRRIGPILLSPTSQSREMAKSLPVAHQTELAIQVPAVPLF